MALISEVGRDLKSFFFILKCPTPPWDQNALCVEVSLLSQIKEARISQKISFIPLDPT